MSHLPRLHMYSSSRSRSDLPAWAKNLPVLWLWLWMLPLGVILLIGIGGCAADISSGSRQTGPAADEALLSLYLETKGLCSTDVTLRLENLVLKSEMQEVPLYFNPVTLEWQKVQDRQVLLGLAKVPAGYYDDLEVDVVLATPNGTSLEKTLSLRFPQTVDLDEGSSQCLFLTWNLDGCVGADRQLEAKLTAHGQEQPLSQDLLFVLCDETRTLYLVRTDTRFVTAAIGLDGVVTELAVHPDRQTLYLLNRSRRSLQALDLTTLKLVDRIPLPLAVEPTSLALDVVQNAAFVSDPRVRMVLRVDLDDGQVTARQQADLPPGELAFLQQASPGLLAVSLPMAQQVMILDAETLAVQKTFNTGLQPRNLLAAGGRLYIAETGSQTVSIYDVSSGQQIGQVRLFGEPADLLADDAIGKVYVSNRQTDSLAVIEFGQVSSARSISVGSTPGALALSGRRGAIFIANPDARAVTTLDLASERVLNVTQVGAAIKDLVVYE